MTKMNINYEIMKDIGGKYFPDYAERIANATCQEEAEAWRKASKNMNEGFVFNMVVCLRMKCGDWEVFQSPVNEYYSLEDTLDELIEHSKNYKCTRCVCGW